MKNYIINYNYWQSSTPWHMIIEDTTPTNELKNVYQHLSTNAWYVVNLIQYILTLWLVYFYVCYLFTVSNPEHKVTLHWADENTNPTGKKESITLTNDVQPLKYRLHQPTFYTTRETWSAGKKSPTYKTLKVSWTPLRGHQNLNTLTPYSPVK